jgi:hypothetical protein
MSESYDRDAFARGQRRRSHRLANVGLEGKRELFFEIVVPRQRTLIFGIPPVYASTTTSISMRCSRSALSFALVMMSFVIQLDFATDRRYVSAGYTKRASVPPSL